MKDVSTYAYSFFVTMILWGMGVNTFAQDRCGIVEQTQLLRNKKLLHESDAQFENWLTARKARASARSQSNGPMRIAVVVHVIHKGEELGEGSNISDAQIMAQIAVLNRDFNRLNADAANTPEEFVSVAGSLEIEFALAAQSPDGFPTTGIVRAQGTQNQWSIGEEGSLKALSYWPAEDYLNLWVTDLSSTLLGYAQFPISTLEGLEDSHDNRLTDGAVVDYTVFGSNENGGTFRLSSTYNRGRTTTHEVGHFFGLRHIWGDDSGACGGNNDYVADTPDQGGNTSGCPSASLMSCSVRTMFQNYMDYTNDVCMNLFTQQQVDRMITVLENSPRRKSLLTSPGLEVLKANDLGITLVQSPAESSCSDILTPIVQVKNYGTNPVSSARVQLSVEGTVIETRQVTFSTPLTTQATGTVTFASFQRGPGSYKLDFQVVRTNGVTDERSENDLGSITTFLSFETALPLTETFTSLPPQWRKSNPDGDLTWDIHAAPQSSTSNTAAHLNFYQYDVDGAMDVMVTPRFDLSAATSPYLYFDVAYAQRALSSDGLKVYVLTNCESDVSLGAQVYFKSGASLATTSTRSTSFVPTDGGDWRTEIIDLNGYRGQSGIQLAFVGINDNGNNLYLDNVKIVPEVFENVRLSGIVSPSPVICAADGIPRISIYNAGPVAVNNLIVSYRVNNGVAREVEIVEGFSLEPGQDSIFSLPQIQLEEGANTLAVELKTPNGVTDIDPSDNDGILNLIVNPSTDLIPLRENFDDNTFTETWSIVNPGGGEVWQQATTNYGRSLYFKTAAETSTPDEAWLVSPSLDFSGALTASVFFDVAYEKGGSGSRNAAVSNLKILASQDCGETYDRVVFDGSQLATESSIGLIAAPSSPNDWSRLYVNLNALSGNSAVRLAFVFTNGSGNDIYLDNIEFFTSDDPTPQLATEPFIVYGTDLSSPNDFFVTFNLETRQDVTYDLVDMTGRVLITEELDEVLNQTYTVASANTSSGVYVLRIQIGDAYYSKRVYIGR